MMEKDCQQCLELLPWYVNGSLSVTQAQQVFQHIEQCQPCAAELRFLSSLQQQVRAQEVETPAPAWRGLQRRLGKQPRNANRRWTRAWVPAAAIVAVIAVVVVRMPSPVDQSEKYRLLTSDSTAQPSHRHNLLRVLPVSSADKQAVAQLFSSIDAEVIAGPTSRGVYTITLRHDVADRDAFVATLRNNKTIDFVEWVDQP